MSIPKYDAYETFIAVFFNYLDAPLPSYFACENKELELSCEDGKLIEITSANYGRQVSTSKNITKYSEEGSFK